LYVELKFDCSLVLSKIKTNIKKIRLTACWLAESVIAVTVEDDFFSPRHLLPPIARYLPSPFVSR